MQLKSYQSIPQMFRKARRGVHMVTFRIRIPTFAQMHLIHFIWNLE